MVAVKILADKAPAENAAAFEKEMKMLMDFNFQHKNVVNLLGEFLLLLFPHLLSTLLVSSSFTLPATPAVDGQASAQPRSRTC